MKKSFGWIGKLHAGLKRSADRLKAPILGIFKGVSAPCDTTLDALEAILIQSDMGVNTTCEIIAELRAYRWKDVETPDVGGVVLEVLRTLLARRLLPCQGSLSPDPGCKPWVCVLVGVNGSGKTTTAGKLAAQWQAEGRDVGLVAGDTFRAAAVEQLAIWAKRSNAAFYSGAPGCDTASLALESLGDAQVKGRDVLLVDTAGRLHTKSHLMDELSKLERVLKKKDPTAPHKTVLVLDATVGQNALSQVALFHKALALSGLILTKVDGTAKGGIVLQLTQEFDLPIYGVGMGEGVGDLQPFQADAFAAGLVGMGEESPFF